MIYGNYAPDTGLSEINHRDWQPICYSDKIEEDAHLRHCVASTDNPNSLLLCVGLWNQKEHTFIPSRNGVKLFRTEQELETFLKEWV